MRRRAVWCAVKFGVLPSRFYEKEPHHDMSYVAHLWMNVRYAARWALGREDDGDRDFEREVNS